MTKIKAEKNEFGAYPCKACLRKHVTCYPVLKSYSGLVYAQCSNPECDKFDPYEFIGSTKNNAVHNWNETMVHDYDSSDKRDYNKGINNENED